MTLSKVSQVAGEKGPLHVPAYNSGLSKGLGTGRLSGQGMFLELDCYGSNHAHHLLTGSRAGYTSTPGRLRSPITSYCWRLLNFLRS